MRIVSVWVIGVIGVKGLQHLIFNHSIETNLTTNNIYTPLSILTSKHIFSIHIYYHTHLHLENLSDYISGHFTLLFFYTSQFLYRSYSQIISITKILLQTMTKIEREVRKERNNKKRICQNE